MATEEKNLNEEMDFDLTKKKKKKSKGLSLEAEKELELAGEDLRKKQDDLANEDLFGADDGKEIDTTQFDDLDLGKKKKKKPKKDLNLEEGGGELDLVDELDDLDLEGLGKKKKKKKKVVISDIVDTETTKEEEKAVGDRPWLNRDLSVEGYRYDELLNRAFKIINAKNPEGSGGQQKIVMQPPKLARIGTKKTCFTNFQITADLLNRKQEHLMLFIFAELGTTGNMDAGGQLILKGKFQAKAMEKVLKLYCKEFVQCKTCKSYTTTLEKRDRLFFVLCKDCQSERTVQAITKGFVAITNKRSRLRNAAAAAAQK